MLDTLTEFETKTKALIHVQLPKIGAALTVKAKAEIDAAIKDVEVNLPLIAAVTISAGININAALEIIAIVALEVIAKLDARVSAEAILKSL